MFRLADAFVASRIERTCYVTREPQGMLEIVAVHKGPGRADFFGRRACFSPAGEGENKQFGAVFTD